MWNHSLVNIDEYIILDIFNQLLKLVVGSMHIFQWLKIIIKAKFKEACVKAGTMKSLQQANKIVPLDQYFHAISSYLTLKIFKKYNKVKQ